MSRDCFINLTTDDNIRKLDIAPELIESFKRVMYKIQEYFNTHGYSDNIDFETIINNYLLPKDIVDKELLRNSINFKEYLQKRTNAIRNLEQTLGLPPTPVNEMSILEEYISENYNVGLRFKIFSNKRFDSLDNAGEYNQKNNEIDISSETLNSNNLDSTLCHEFIHFLTICGEKELGAITNVLSPAIYEPLTEMLSTAIIDNSKKYSSYVRYCELMEYINNISGVDNFTAFLRRKLDDKYQEHINYFSLVQDIFNKNKYLVETNGMTEEEMSMLINTFTTSLIFKDFKDVKSLTDTLSMLYTAPQIYELKDALINVVNSSIDNFLSNLGINNVELKKQIIELIKVKNELRILAGKRYSKIDINGEIYLFDELGNVYLKGINYIIKIDRENIDMSYTVDNGILIINISDGTTKRYDLSTIDYNMLGNSLITTKENLETSINNLLNPNQNIGKINTPYIKKEVRDEVIFRTFSEFRKAEEQENHILPKEETKQQKLNRPKIKIEVIRSVILRNDREKLEELKKQLIEQNTTTQEFIEEELDHGMSM